jgi:cell division protease FtsH
MPTEDRYSISRNELLDQMAYAMGGRVAEEIVFDDPSTGASNDIEKATDTARKMVTEYGMSAVLGPIKTAANENDQAIGGATAAKYAVSGHIQKFADEEVQALLKQAHSEAVTVIYENREVLDRLVVELLEKETLLEEDLERIFADVKRWGERPKWQSIV